MTPTERPDDGRGDHGPVWDPSDLQQPHRCPHCGDKRCGHGYDPSLPCIRAAGSVGVSDKEAGNE